MKILKMLDKALFHIEEFSSALAMIIMCLVVSLGIVYRYLGIPFPTSEEIARYLMIFSIYLGLGIVCRKDAHVSVTLIVERFPKKLATAIKALMQLLTIMTFCWLFFLSLKWLNMVLIPRKPQLTPMTRIPFYFIYSFTVVGFALSIIRSIQLFVWKFIMNRESVAVVEEAEVKAAIEAAGTVIGKEGN